MKQILPLILIGLTSSLIASDRDREIVAATLILEAGGEYVDGALEAVHEVIQNRAVNRRMTKAEVCLQRWQFSCWNNRSIDDGIRKAKTHPRWNEALRITYIYTNYTNGADHYHAHYVRPYWADLMTVTAIIGNHIFYKQ